MKNVEKYYGLMANEIVEIIDEEWEKVWLTMEFVEDHGKYYGRYNTKQTLETVPPMPLRSAQHHRPRGTVR